MGTIASGASARAPVPRNTQTMVPHRGTWAITLERSPRGRTAHPRAGAYGSRGRSRLDDWLPVLHAELRDAGMRNPSRMHCVRAERTRQKQRCKNGRSDRWVDGTTSNSKKPHPVRDEASCCAWSERYYSRVNHRDATRSARVYSPSLRGLHTWRSVADRLAARSRTPSVAQPMS